MRFELTTSTLATLRSTTELHSLVILIFERKTHIDNIPFGVVITDEFFKFPHFIVGGILIGGTNTVFILHLHYKFGRQSLIHIQSLFERFSSTAGLHATTAKRTCGAGTVRIVPQVSRHRNYVLFTPPIDPPLQRSSISFGGLFGNDFAFPKVTVSCVIHDCHNQLTHNQSQIGFPKEQGQSPLFLPILYHRQGRMSNYFHTDMIFFFPSKTERVAKGSIPS